MAAQLCSLSLSQPSILSGTSLTPLSSSASSSSPSPSPSPSSFQPSLSIQSSLNPRNSTLGERTHGAETSLKSNVFGQQIINFNTVISPSPQRKFAVVAMSLPASKWSARAIKSFSMGELEARKLKYPTTGTEALLMGMLTEGTSAAARFLRANGITLSGVRDETIKLLGKADMFYFSAEHPPLTEPALAALNFAIEQRQGEGEVTTEHLLLGIWKQSESAGHKILATLGFSDDKANELAGMMKKEPVAR